MKTYFSKSKIKSKLFCSFLICLVFQIVPAFGIDKEQILETENQAEQLSNQWSGETIRRSISLYLKAAENWEKLAELKNSSNALRESAKLAQLVSDYETAFSSLNRSIKIDEKSNYVEGKVISLSLLSQISRQKGETEKSESYYKQAIKLSEQSPTDLAQANAFYSAGIYSTYYGNINSTLELLEKALSFANKTDDKNLTAQIHRDLGAAYAREGDSDKGLENMNNSLKIADQTNNKREQALSYFTIGFQYLLIDKRQIAFDNFKKAERGFPNDIDWLYKARIFNATAFIYEIYGELNIAEKYRTDALELYERAEYPTGVLTTLTSLAELKEIRGETATSRAFYENALNLAKQLKDEFQIGLIKEDFGDIALKNGDYDSAIENYQAALAIIEKLKVKLPRIQNSLGKAYQRNGDLQLAQENYQIALDANLKSKELAPAAENLHNLAHLNFSSGNIDKAFEYSNESIKISESLYTDVENSKLRQTFLSNIYDRYELNIHLLMNMHKRFPGEGYELKALQASEKSRSRSLLENLRLTEANFTADADPEMVKRENEIRGFLTIKAEKLTRALTSGGSDVEIKNIEEQINDLRNELEELKVELKQKSPVYSTIKNPPDFDIEEFQKNILDDKTLLLEFSFGEKESYLWTIGDKEFDVFVLPRQEILNESLDKIHNLLVPREKKPENETDEDYQKRISEAENDYWKESQVLSNQLFGQAKEKLSNKRLVFVTDGKLRYFPISALPFPNDGETSKINEPFLLTNEIVYEPSASTLNLLRKTSNKAKPPEKDLLIFADPVYSRNDERLSQIQSESFEIAENQDPLSRTGLNSGEPLNSLQRLPSTKEESELTFQLFGSGNSDLITGFAANRKKFFDSDLSKYKVLHFATHGSLNEEHPEFSALVLSQYDQNGNKQDGFVRLQDIYGLNLSADLVVLSACDTGIGKEIKGEGLISLTEVFLQVGAKTVVSTRWKVSDKTTTELMKNFYQIMNDENIPPSEALRKAQIKLRENPLYKSPYHWAAFTIQGDYQNKPAFLNKSKISGYVLFVIFLFTVFGIYRGIRYFKRHYLK